MYPFPLVIVVPVLKVHITPLGVSLPVKVHFIEKLVSAWMFCTAFSTADTGEVQV